MGLMSKIPFVQAWKDISNYRKWKKTIKGERVNPNSLLNKYNINNNVFYNLYVAVTLPDEDKVLPDKIKQLRIVESLAPVHRYLDNDLGFAGSIVPEFNRVYNDEGDATLTYVAVYRFAFNKISLKFILIRLILLIGFIIAYLKIPWEILF